MKETDKMAYLSSEHAFLKHRINYYANTKTISTSDLGKKIFPDVFKSSEQGQAALEQRSDAFVRLRNSQAQITIVTATKNRPNSHQEAYEFLGDQTGGVTWNWLIVDNGGDNETKNTIANFKDNRIIHVVYKEENGCAYPVRNFGLDLVHFAKQNQVKDSGYVLVVDSDDRLYGENSLRELLKIANSKLAKSKGLYITHGFADSEIYQTEAEVFHVPNPRDWDSSFPQVNSLKEVFDKGLNILSGMFPVELLTWLRYPAEVSFEDDGFNQKIMLQAKKHSAVWIAEVYPITVKRFHQESMSTVNNQRGDISLAGQVGEHRVTGMRAQIVYYLQKLSDYYTQENL